MHHLIKGFIFFLTAINRSTSVSSVGKYRIIPFLKYQGASSLQAVFITHPDEDHCNGIKELIEIGTQEGIRIKNLILPDIDGEAKNSAYIELEQQAAVAGILVSYMSRGQQIKDDKLVLSCLHPQTGYRTDNANEYSLVMEAAYGQFKVMLAGDIEGSGEGKMIQYLDKKETDTGITALKAAHHGSAYSTPDAFLELTNPVYTVISCGRDNSYGHPHAELLERLKKHNANILITYETGAVTFVTDGQKVRVNKFLYD